MVTAGRLPRAALVLRRVLAVARVGAEPVVPGLPGVAVDEAERARVGGQPGIGGGRSEVELRGVAVKARAGWRDPLRVRIGGEQARLLGVGAERAGDRQGEPVAAGRCGHPVERRGHVGAHRLAHPVGERAVIAAALTMGGPAEDRIGRRGQLGRRARPHRHRPRPLPHPHRRRAARDHPHARGRERPARKAHVRRAQGHPVGLPHAQRPLAREREIRGQRQAPRARLEQPRIGIAHRRRGRHRRQIRRALMARLRPSACPNPTSTANPTNNAATTPSSKSAA